MEGTGIRLVSTKKVSSVAIVLLFAIVITSLHYYPQSAAASINSTSQAGSNSTNILPPPIPKLPLFTGTATQGKSTMPNIPIGTSPLGTPILGPNQKSSISPLVVTNHWWDITYYFQNTNDYHGQFVAQANNIQGLGSADDILILPLNVALGPSSTNFVWFQFDIDFSRSCSGGVCNSGVFWAIWNNPNPTGPCGTSITYNPNDISSPSTFTNGLAYTPGDSYHWDLYPDSSRPGFVVFLVVDDTKGGINNGSFWWNEWQVPSMGLVNDPSCFSPAAAVEGYTTSTVTSLTSVPFYNFLEEFGIGGPSVESRFGSGEPSGISEGMTQIGSSGNWYWQMFQTGLFVPVSITLLNDGSSTSISALNDYSISYHQKGSSFSTNYYSSSGGSKLTLPADPNTNVVITGMSSGSASNSEKWCFNNACSNTSLSSGSAGATASYYYYDTLPQDTSFSVAGGGTPKVNMTYVTPPLSSGGSDTSLKQKLLLSTMTQGISALRGSNSSVPSCAPNSPTCGSAGQRWVTTISQPTSWIITAANVISNPIHYKHQYFVMFASSPSGNGTTNPSSGWFDAGSNMTISAIPTSGYKFDSWSSNTTNITLGASTANSTAKINGTGTITANFKPLPPRTVSINNVNNTSPMWGNPISVSGNVSNPQIGDTATILWGDGKKTTGIPISSNLWGPVVHKYDSTSSGSSANITAIIKDTSNNTAASSLTVSVNIQKHSTSLFLATVNNIPWGMQVIVKGNLTDSSAGGIGIGGKQITFATSGDQILSTVTSPNGTFTASSGIISTQTYMNATNTVTGVAVYGANTRHLIAEHANSTSILVGKNINTIKLKLKGLGLPPGYFQVGVFDVNQHIKKLFANVTASSLATSYTVYSFTTGSNYTIVPDDYIGLFYNANTNSANSIAVMRDNVTNFDGANSQEQYFDTKWHKDGVFDLYMELQNISMIPPTIVKNGLTVQAQFAGDLPYLNSNSSTQTYNTLRHNVLLNLSINPNIVSANSTYSVSGNLKDVTFGIPLAGITIHFVTDNPMVTIPDAVTSANGIYSQNGLVAPNLPSGTIVHVIAKFLTDPLYNGITNTKTLTLA
ncbi:MAG TPA: hypothetical protein VLT10_00065 [Verrucomicrobiae bacterium]|nr:hypothetical protein [Verrucomicrobiae bacterium]